MSFLDNENQMVVGAILSEIGDQLVENWLQENLNEGQLYADYQVALMSDNNYLKGRFNLFYNLQPNDEYYLEWNEEA